MLPQVENSSRGIVNADRKMHRSLPRRIRKDSALSVSDAGPKGNDQNYQGCDRRFCALPEIRGSE
jgi:hypothetical protein